MASSFDVLKFFSICLVQYSVDAYYCNSGRCSADEYCCGDNLCCTDYTVWRYWYFWCGLVLFLILLTVCAGCFRYKYYQQRALLVTYTPTYRPLDEDHSTERNTGYFSSEPSSPVGPGPYGGPPPPYKDIADPRVHTQKYA